jgi:hypothetical protein
MAKAWAMEGVIGREKTGMGTVAVMVGRVSELGLSRQVLSVVGEFGVTG